MHGLSQPDVLESETMPPDLNPKMIRRRIVRGMVSSRIDDETSFFVEEPLVESQLNETYNPLDLKGVDREVQKVKQEHNERQAATHKAELENIGMLSHIANQELSEHERKPSTAPMEDPNNQGSARLSLLADVVDIVFKATSAQPPLPPPPPVPFQPQPSQPQYVPPPPLTMDNHQVQRQRPAPPLQLFTQLAFDHKNSVQTPTTMSAASSRTPSLSKPSKSTPPLLAPAPPRLAPPPPLPQPQQHVFSATMPPPHYPPQQTFHFQPQPQHYQFPPPPTQPPMQAHPHPQSAGGQPMLNLGAFSIPPPPSPSHSVRSAPPGPGPSPGPAFAASPTSPQGPPPQFVNMHGSPIAPNVMSPNATTPKFTLQERQPAPMPFTFINSTAHTGIKKGSRNAQRVLLPKG